MFPGLLRNVLQTYSYSTGDEFFHSCLLGYSFHFILSAAGFPLGLYKFGSLCAEKTKVRLHRLKQSQGAGHTFRIHCDHGLVLVELRVERSFRLPLSLRGRDHRCCSPEDAHRLCSRVREHLSQSTRTPSPVVISRGSYA